MTSPDITGNVFRPRPSRTESRAMATDRAARAIMTAEAQRREAKTRRLRQARLEQEAQQTP